MNLQLRAFFICFILPIAIFGQDNLYSQYLNAPTILNPSLTGHIQGGYRLAVLHRSQWSGIPNVGGFSTPSLGFDVNLDRNNKNSIGFGFNMMNDQQGGGQINTLSTLVGIAFHISIDDGEEHFISVGYQHGFVHRRIDLTGLTFESDFTGEGAEDIALNRVTAQDNAAGIVWSFYPNKFSAFKLGFSAAHLIPIRETFIAEVSQIATRYSIHADLEYDLTKKVGIQPHFIFSRQGRFEQLHFGVNTFYNFTEGNKVMLGTGYRSGDAIILTGGVQIKKAYFFTFSYDINTSALNVATNGNGGFEVGFRFVGQIARSYIEEKPGIRY